MGFTQTGNNPSALERERNGLPAENRTKPIGHHRLAPSRRKGTLPHSARERGRLVKQRKFGEERVIKLLRDAKKGEGPLQELCWEAVLHPASFYMWKVKYGDATVEEAKRLRQLGRENERLLKLVGQQRLELEGIKESLSKKR